MLGSRSWVAVGAFGLLWLSACSNHKKASDAGLADAGPDADVSENGGQGGQGGKSGAGGSAGKAGAGGKGAAGSAGKAAAAGKGGSAAGSGGSGGKASAGSGGTAAGAGGTAAGAGGTAAGAGGTAAGSGGSAAGSGGEAAGAGGDAAGSGGEAAGAGGDAAGAGGEAAGSGGTSGAGGAGGTGGTGGAGGSGVPVPGDTKLSDLSTDDQATTVCLRIQNDTADLGWQAAGEGYCALMALPNDAPTCMTMLTACTSSGDDPTPPCSLSTIPKCTDVTVDQFVTCRDATLNNFVDYYSQFSCSTDKSMVPTRPTVPECTGLPSDCMGL